MLTIENEAVLTLPAFGQSLGNRLSYDFFHGGYPLRSLTALNHEIP